MNNGWIEEKFSIPKISYLQKKTYDTPLEVTSSVQK